MLQNPLYPRGKVEGKRFGHPKILLEVYTEAAPNPAACLAASIFKGVDALFPAEKLLELTLLPSPIKNSACGTYTISTPKTLKLSSAVGVIDGLVVNELFSFKVTVWVPILPIPLLVLLIKTPIPSPTASTVNKLVAAVTV